MSSIRGDLQISRNASTRSLRVETNVVATTASTMTLTVFSKSQHIFTGSTPGQIVKLPDSSILEVGHIFWIRNRSTVSLEIVDSMDGRILSLFPYQTAFLNLQNGAWAWSVEDELLQDTIETTTADPIVAQTISVPTDSVLVLEMKALGVRTGGTAGSAGDSASYHRIARFKNVAGTVTRHTLQTVYTSEDQAGWNATLQVSGTDVQIIVSGSSNNQVFWAISTHLQISAF